MNTGSEGEGKDLTKSAGVHEVDGVQFWQKPRESLEKEWPGEAFASPGRVGARGFEILASKKGGRTRATREKEGILDLSPPTGCDTK